MIKLSIQDLLKSHNFKKYFFNTGWLLTEKFLRLLVGIFVGVYVARYLGPEQFGVLSFSMSFVALFGAFSKVGLDYIVVRNAVKNTNGRDELLGTAFVLKLFGGLSLLAFVFITIQFIENDPLIKLIVIIIASVHLLQAFDVIDFYFQSQIQGRLISISSMLSLLVSSALKLSMIWSNASIVCFAWVIVIEQGVKGFALCYMYIKKFNTILHWRFRFIQATNLLKDSWPLIFSGLVIMVYMRIDQVMIKLMLGNESAGIYAAAVQLSDVWLFITVTITNSLMPSIIKAKYISENTYYKNLLVLYRFLITIALLISIFMTLYAKFIVLHLFGEEYIKATSVLKIYIWSIIFVYLNNASWQWYIAENLQRIAFYRLLFGAILNVVCNFYLIHKIGIEGAAWSTLLSYSFATYIGNLFSSKTIINFKLQTKSLLTIFSFKDYKIW